MLHTKFQDHTTTGFGGEDFLKIFTIYERGGHLGHMIWTIYTNFCSPFLRRLRIKCCFDLASSFREEDV